MKIWLCNYMSSDVGKINLRARMVATFVLGGFNGHIHLADELDGYPSNNELNYGFKTYCLCEALKNRADIAIWSDTNMLLIKPFNELVRAIKSGPPVFLMKNAGWKAGQWTHDRCLDEFGVSRSEAYNIPTVVSGFVAYDFTDPLAVDFFNEFKSYSLRPEIINGPRYAGGSLDVYDNSYFGHRHDQSILSLMAHKKNIMLHEGLYADPANAVGVPAEFQIPTTERTIIEWLP